MTNLTVWSDEHEWWKPSLNQLEPKCLSDFSKLVGRPLDILDSVLGRVNAAVVVYTISYTAGIESILKLIEDAMHFLLKV
jgi:hypothetical protein